MFYTNVGGEFKCKIFIKVLCIDKGHKHYFAVLLPTRYNPFRQYSLLHRLSVIFGFHRLLLPAETTVSEKWLPAEIVRRITLTDGKKPFIMYNSHDRKQKIADSLGGSQI